MNVHISLKRNDWIFLQEVVFPSGRHCAVAVDLRRVVQIAGKQKRRGRSARAWCQVLQGVRHCATRMRCECFWAKCRQCASWLEPCRCMEVNVRLYTLATRLQRDCATTVHEKMWRAVGVSVCTPCRLPGDYIPGKRNEISEQRRKNYCSVQDDVCHESQLQFDFQSPLCCQCDDEDECVVL